MSDAHTDTIYVVAIWSLVGLLILGMAIPAILKRKSKRPGPKTRRIDDWLRRR